MNERICLKRFTALCALALTACLAAPAALSEPVVLAAGSALSSGKQSFSSELDIGVPGTLTVQVSDLGVPFTIVDRLASLSFSVSSTSGSIWSQAGEGLVSLDITNPGLYLLHIAAVPAARFQLGLVSWSALYTPSAAPVPLPAGVWFLAVGAAWAAGLRRRRQSRNVSVTCVA